MKIQYVVQLVNRTNRPANGPSKYCAHLVAIDSDGREHWLMCGMGSMSIDLCLAQHSAVEDLARVAGNLGGRIADSLGWFDENIDAELVRKCETTFVQPHEWLAGKSERIGGVA